MTPELKAAVDFGRTSDDYAKYRPGPPASFYERLDAMVPIRGGRVVDVGAGTGVVGLELARRGASVVLVDPSANQVGQASRLAREAGLAGVETAVAKAESLPLADGSVDLWIASQAWHWFDPKAAGAEAMRVLRPGGRIVTVSFDYLPGRSEVARRTEELILKYNPTWPLANGTGCHVAPLFNLPDAGFVGLEQFSYEHEQVFTHEAWRGRMRTCNGVGASLAPERVRAFDAELAELLVRIAPDPCIVVHRVWVVGALRPS